MTTTLSVPAASTDRAGSTPSPVRRVAVAVTGLLACALPTSFLVSTVVMLATGTEADHRFHQVTGQGLLLCAVWLAGLVPLVLAGWRGRAPAPAAVLHAAAVAGSALALGVWAPGAGALSLAVIVAVTTTLLWAALPARPRLRAAFGPLDPVVAPLTLLAAALLTPFVIGEVGLQNAFADEHAEMAHYFDMAWVSVAIVLLGAIASVVPAARSRALWTTGGLLLIGASRLVFTADVTWSVLAIALGAVGTAALLVRRPAR